MRRRFTAKPVKSDQRLTTETHTTVNMVNETKETITILPIMPQHLANPSVGTQINQTAQDTNLAAISSPFASVSVPSVSAMDSGKPGILVVDNNALKVTVSPDISISQSGRETLKPLPVVPIAFRGFEAFNGSATMPAI